MTKILVIDDDPQLRGLIVQILAAAGYQMLEANDGQQGLSLFRIHQPALIITDILMPGKEGLETIRQLRAEAPKVAIIAMSGRGADFLAMARKFGAAAVIAKPFHIADLATLVNDLLLP